MAIHFASDDGPDVASYCTRNDVLDFAVGIDTDDSDNVLSSLGANAAQRNRLIDRLIPLAFKDVNMWARRDFDHHPNKTVVMDGQNTDDLILANWGFWPLLSVASLTIDDTLVDTDDYKVYLGEDATISFAEASVFVPPLPKRKRRTELFTEGRQNVSIVCSWGWESPPSEVVAAQCYAVLARCLKHLGATTDPKAPGIPPGVTQVSEGQFRTIAKEGARYAHQAMTFEAMAKELCFDFHRVKVVYADPRDLR